MASEVAIEVERLIIGRKLNFPIHDTNGVLLLGTGCTLTSDLKRRLGERGIHEVVVDEGDIGNITVQDDLAEASFSQLDRELAGRLDALIRPERLKVVNTGAPLRDRVVVHGRKPCDRRTQQMLHLQHEQSSQAVDRFMDEVLTSDSEVDGQEVGAIADGYISHLVADLSSSLAVGFAKNQDPTLAQHAVNVALLGMAIGLEMGLDAENIGKIGMTGLVHDLGMAAVPESIRNAPRPLTKLEFLEIQKHPIRTANLLEKVRGIPSLVQLASYQVHEKTDGSGYPRGRDRSSIHLFARILHVADAYTAMTTQRPYRPPIMGYVAMETLLRQAQHGQVDSQVVRCLLQAVSLFPIGSFVTLSDSSIAQVLRANGTDFTRPIVIRLQDENGDRFGEDDESAIVDLSQSSLSIVQALPTPGRREISRQTPTAFQPV
jgi:HD-GYP domain-containing protein (c-di-GMP phosphodiesterase class II)